MAEEGSRSHSAKVRVWTFLVRGGEPFDLFLPNNPPLIHPGGKAKTEWKLVGTTSLMVQASEQIRSLGSSLEVFMEDESLEQRRIREALLRGDLSSIG